MSSDVATSVFNRWLGQCLTDISTSTAHKSESVLNIDRVQALDSREYSKRQNPHVFAELKVLLSELKYPAYELVF